MFSRLSLIWAGRRGVTFSMLPRIDQCCLIPLPAVSVRAWPAPDGLSRRITPSLHNWRLAHPHDTPPYPFMPSPTFAHSSRYLSMLGFHPECFGHPDQIGHRSRSHFLHKMTAMHFHGDLAEADFGCDLFAHQPARHQSHD